MTQQISVETIQPDRFSVDPVSDLLESSVGEEIYITQPNMSTRAAAISTTSQRHWSVTLTARARWSTSAMWPQAFRERSSSLSPPIPQEHWQEKLPIPMRTLPARAQRQRSILHHHSGSAGR